MGGEIAQLVKAWVSDPDLFVCCYFMPQQWYFSYIMVGDMMYQMRRRKRKPTLLPTQGTFNLQHHLGMVWEELAFDDAVSYTQQGNGLEHS